MDRVRRDLRQTAYGAAGRAVVNGLFLSLVIWRIRSDRFAAG